jgi:hypothetical protein
MLVQNVEWMMRLRGIQEPFAYLTSNGFTKQEALSLLDKENDAIVFDEISRLIVLLNCTLNDLTDWNGNPESHLVKLKKPTLEELDRMLEKLSPEEVLDIVRGIEK